MHLKNKVVIIGAGCVGSTAAYSMVVQDAVDEIVLIDKNKKLALSQAMDLEHAMPLCGYTKIKVGGYSNCRDAKVAFICCGTAQKSGETRLDLLKRNAEIVKEVLPKIFQFNPRIVIVMVTNPVDVLTCLAVKMFPKKANQIIGSGTVLDSARLRYFLGEKLNINPKSIHAYIVGEHGDSSLALWSTAMVGNVSLDKGGIVSIKDRQELFEKARSAAYAIIGGKQATYYGIGVVIAQLARTICRDKNTVLAVSHRMIGEYGIKGVCLSMPVVVGAHGIAKRLKLKISPLEKRMLSKSAKILKEVCKRI